VCTHCDGQIVMAKEIIVNASMAEDIRIAILEEGRLIDLDIETQGRTKHKGNIYKGIISNIEDSLDAAFVEFGEERQAFLPLAEVRPSLIPPELKDQKRLKMSQIFVRGQEIVVQVTKDEIGTKGAAVTTYLSLPGRFVVLMHSDESGGGISRKIENENARQSARDMLSRLSVPEGMAVIIRTAGMNASPPELVRDFRALCEIWQRIDKGAQLGRAPTLLYREPDIVIRTIRDYFSSEVSRVVIDDEEEFNEVHKFFSDHMPDMVQYLQHHQKREPIFQAFGIEQSIEDLYKREVKLPSGGYIVIEPTEALVSIDVNSGRSTKEEGHASTVFKTNLEATEEVARQLRLRDLGGIIVIDFIDMILPKHRREVERRLRNAMHADKARVKIGNISENGTLELTRQRLRQSHHLVSHVLCDRCQGTGRVRDAQGLSILALRRIGAHLAKKRVQLSTLKVRLPVEVANVLSNTKRKELVEHSESYQLEIHILGDAHMHDTAIAFEEERRGQAGLDQMAQNRDAWSESSHGRHHYGHHRAVVQPKPNLPPPTIGPVPTLIDIEDLGEEWIASDKTLAEKANERVIYDDPIMEALFGQAPPLTVTLEGEEDLKALKAADKTEGAADEEGKDDQVKDNFHRMRRRRRRSHRSKRSAIEGRPNAGEFQPPKEGQERPAPASSSEE